MRYAKYVGLNFGECMTYYLYIYCSNKRRLKLIILLLYKRILLSLMLMLTLLPVYGENLPTIVKYGAVKISYIAPNYWVAGSMETGSTIASIISPRGSLFANCSIQAKQIHGAVASQSDINSNMLQLPDERELEMDLNKTWRNASLLSLKNTIIDGYIGQLATFEHGSGKNWIVQTAVTVVLAPNMIISATCGGGGKTIQEARESYEHWRTVINIFFTNIKINTLYK